MTTTTKGPPASRSSDARRQARQRALRAAAAVTLGLAALGAEGCTQTADLVCRAFENNRICCERAGSTWDESSRTCYAPMPVPGPFVPPDLPA